MKVSWKGGKGSPAKTEEAVAGSTNGAPAAAPGERVNAIASHLAKVRRLPPRDTRPSDPISRDRKTMDDLASSSLTAAKSPSELPTPRPRSTCAVSRSTLKTMRSAFTSEKPTRLVERHFGRKLDEKECSWRVLASLFAWETNSRSDASFLCRTFCGYRHTH